MSVIEIFKEIEQCPWECRGPVDALRRLDGRDEYPTLLVETSEGIGHAGNRVRPLFRTEVALVGLEPQFSCREFLGTYIVGAFLLL
jgi:hypothetical protein